MQIKPYIVCSEIQDDDDHYAEVSRHSSSQAAERKASKYERDTGLTTWVDYLVQGSETPRSLVN